MYTSKKKKKEGKEKKRKGKKKRKKEKTKGEKENKQRIKGIYIYIVLVQYINTMCLNLYVFYTTEYYSHCNLTMLKYIITSILYYNKSNQL